MRLKSDLILLFVAFIWGSAFAAQRVASQYFGTFFFNGSRFLLAVIVLLPFIRRPWKLDKKILPWLFLAGVFLYLGSALQQAGLETTTAGSAGFMTGLYVVIVPVLLALFWRQKTNWVNWVAALIAAVGAGLLGTGGTGTIFPLHLGSGDGLVLIGSLFWALHVILVGKVINRTDVLQFAIGQYAVCGLLQLGTAAFIDVPTWASLRAAWWTIAYVGIFSVAIGYTLQAFGQKFSPPTDAALILSMESVFSAVFGFLMLGERLDAIQIMGCLLILAAIVLVQVLPGREESREQRVGSSQSVMGRLGNGEEESGQT